MNALRLKLARLILGNAGIIFPAQVFVDDRAYANLKTYVYADSHITNE